LERTNGRLQLVVRSKKVLERVENFEVSTRLWSGQLLVSKRTLNVHHYVFDEAQSKALDQARELAEESGLALEVIDLSRQSAIRRILRFGWGMGSVRSSPKVRRRTRPKVVQPQEKREDVSLAACQP